MIIFSSQSGINTIGNAVSYDVTALNFKVLKSWETTKESGHVNPKTLESSTTVYVHRLLLVWVYPWLCSYMQCRRRPSTTHKKMNKTVDRQFCFYFTPGAITQTRRTIASTCKCTYTNCTCTSAGAIRGPRSNAILLKLVMLVLEYHRLSRSWRSGLTSRSRSASGMIIVDLPCVRDF